MDLSIKTIFALLACIIIGVTNFRKTAALQCYSCVDCVDGMDLKEIQICGELPSELNTQQESTMMSTSTTASAIETTATKKTTTKRTTKGTTTTTKKPTTKQDSDSDENSEDYEDSNEDDRRRRYIDGPKQSEPICYMVKYRVNNTEITNRGCTAIVKNHFSTCQSLNRTDATMEDCQLCSKNGCNKQFSDGSNVDFNWDYLLQSSGNKIDFKIMNLIFVVVLMMLFFKP